MARVRRSRPWRALSLFVLAAVPLSVFANGPPPRTETAFVTGLQGAAFRSFIDRMDRSAPGRDLRVMAVALILPYEVIPNRLVVAGAIPYLDKELVLSQGGQRRRLGNSGFGDLTVKAKYQILQRDRPRRTTRLSLLASLKLPTGEDDERSEDGSLLPPSLQLGTGSVDYAGGAVITALRQRWGINGDLIYRVNTSDDGFRFGDKLQLDAALAFRASPRIYGTYPSPQLNLFLELNGVRSGRNRAGGTDIAASGGTSLFIAPGIQYMIGRTFLVEASLQLPVAENLHGDQLEADHSLRMGIRWLIF